MDSKMNLGFKMTFRESQKFPKLEIKMSFRFKNESQNYRGEFMYTQLETNWTNKSSDLGTEYSTYNLKPKQLFFYF